MSEFEDDADIISCPLSTPRSKPFGKGELPQAIEKLLVKCNDTLNEDQMKLACEKIASLSDSFMDPSVLLIGTNAVTHYVDTGSGRKVFIEEEIMNMLQAGVIHVSDSPCSLNDVTRNNSYPLYRIDDNLEAIKGKKMFCTLDLTSGYWEIKMSDMDVEKTPLLQMSGCMNS